MEYVTIKELSAKFAMPERTVYYQINHNPRIRTRKQGRSKAVNVADFAKACGKDLQWSANSTTPLPEENNQSMGFAALQKLQEEKRLAEEKIFALEKVNTNLETNRNKFVQLYTDEKNEKKEVMKKLDDLQEKYHTDIQSFMKKYHLALGFLAVCLALLLALNFEQILAIFDPRA